MKKQYLILSGLVTLVVIALSSIALVNPATATSTSLAETVRQATVQFKDVHQAQAAGYALLHGCVSGQQDGAMGIHFANGALVGDGAIDVSHPEALLYEPKNGTLQLAGVEYVVIADAWNANHQAPPVLMGQLFNYAGSPNRFGLPAFYELHVWAWKNNPAGVFADWNTQVSCADFVGDIPMQGMAH
jgi:hypothetical protein